MINRVYLISTALALLAIAGIIAYSKYVGYKLVQSKNTIKNLKTEKVVQKGKTKVKLFEQNQSVRFQTIKEGDHNETIPDTVGTHTISI